MPDSLFRVGGRPQFDLLVSSIVATPVTIIIAIGIYLIFRAIKRWVTPIGSADTKLFIGMALQIRPLVLIAIMLAFLFIFAFCRGKKKISLIPAIWLGYLVVIFRI